MKTVAIVGLGYVGIPLAVAFGKNQTTIGYDRDSKKINSFRNGLSTTDEITDAALREATYLSFSDDPSILATADFIILAVPTLVSDSHQPEFGPLREASALVAKNMKKGVIVIYESTVYPGATEEVCIPILEQFSGLKWREGFHVGYSPERVNPGDQEHTLQKIIKVVSADDAPTLQTVADLYRSIITAGVHLVSSMKVAEASKVIENTQRDLNIALMNEVAIISHLVGIDTTEVLNAAATKWNFLALKPGLVGGHCIGVVPYYLTYKAEQLGYFPDVILAGRRINDGMGKYIAQQIIKQMIRAGISVKGAKVNLMGLAFKPNVQDLSNSKIIDVVKELETFGVEVFIYDPIVKADDAKQRYGVQLRSWEELPLSDAVIMAVNHRMFLEKGAQYFLTKLKNGGCFVDLHSAFNAEEIRGQGFDVWRL
jgi:UDP-N-acetyl-D-galactosamine dehydrogenase